MQACVRMLILVLSVSGMVCAQQGPPLNGKLTIILDRMRSLDLRTRYVAFNEFEVLLTEGVDMNKYVSEHPQDAQGRDYWLNRFLALHPDQAEPIKLGLIHLLEKENRPHKVAPSESTDVDYGEYLFAVTLDVSALKDERAMKALVGAIPHSGTDILQYGDKALGPMLARRKSPDALVRAITVGLAIRILRTKTDGVSRTRMRELIRSSLEDPSPVVVNKAVQEMYCVDNRQDFVPTLERVAKKDPAKPSVKSPDVGDDSAIFSAGAGARHALQGIQTNEPCRLYP